MNAANDTIAAIATAAGPAGIAIVRVSGPDAFGIADQLFRCNDLSPSLRPADTFVYGHVRTGARDLDEAILLLYRAPASYTREDVVEFQVHGGSASARRLLRAVMAAGARLAEPGEFTRRAFLSGRLDLLQAEAVMDLIQARSDLAAAAAVEQLEGALSKAFNQLHDQLMGIASDLEARLDFEDDELPEASMTPLRKQVEHVRLTLQGMADGWDEGHLLREGALAVIAGKPNVGKSTLMNALLGKSRAIVTDIPGTTRDTIEEQLILDGFPLRIVDTAGIRDANCGIEQEGIRRARSLVDASDIIILLIDGSELLDKLDSRLLERCSPNKTLLVINKIDRGQKFKPSDFTNFRTVECSLRDGIGLDSVKAAMADLLNLRSCIRDPHAVISERHLSLIRKVETRLEQAACILSAAPESFEVMASVEIREAIELLGQITGRHYHAELLDAIFSRFCIGK